MNPWMRAASGALRGEIRSSALRARVLAAWAPHAAALAAGDAQAFEGSTVWLGSGARRDASRGRWSLAAPEVLCEGGLVSRVEAARQRWERTRARCGLEPVAQHSGQAQRETEQWRTAAGAGARAWMAGIGSRRTIERVLERYWQITRGQCYPALGIRQIGVLAKLDAQAWRRLERAPAWLARVAARWLDAATLSGQPEQWTAAWANRWLEQAGVERTVGAGTAARAVAQWPWETVVPPVGIMAALEDAGLAPLESAGEIDAAIGLDLRPELIAEQIRAHGHDHALGALREAWRAAPTMDDAIDALNEEWRNTRSAQDTALEAMRAQWAREDALEGDGTRTSTVFGPIEGAGQALGWRWALDSPEHLIAGGALAWNRGIGLGSGAGAGGPARAEGGADVAERYSALATWSVRTRAVAWVEPHAEEGARVARRQAAQRVLEAR